MEKHNSPGSRQRRWLPPNLCVNRATTFSSDPQKDRDSLHDATGETITPCRPTGAVRLGGRVLDAISDEGFLEPGESIRVVGFCDFKVVVKRVRQ